MKAVMQTAIWAALDAAAQDACLTRPACTGDAAITAAVEAIVADVRTQGDAAVRDCARRFDGIAPDPLSVPAATIAAAAQAIPTAARTAIDTAYQAITRFHEGQGYATCAVETAPGVLCRRMARPVGVAGLYVPGGTAPLVSTTLMLGVPAQIAGCPQRILCTPCDRTGTVNPHILYAAQLCGIDAVFRIGGAQAVAAMAYGTESVPRADKIFGPGNAYVTAAKTRVAQDPQGAAIDMPAGPSEVCVIADRTTDPAFAAADLLSQAEHDTLSQVLLIATDAETAQAVLAQTAAQLVSLPRRAIAEKALENGRAIVVPNKETALAVANRYAPEHLILCFDEADAWVEKVQHAGSVFVGPWSPESAGDYLSGTNHVLPTYGYARSYGGLGVESFQKTMTVQTLSHAGLEGIGPAIRTLAGLEGLDAHARAVTVRLEKGRAG